MSNPERVFHQPSIAELMSEKLMAQSVILCDSDGNPIEVTPARIAYYRTGEEPEEAA